MCDSWLRSLELHLPAVQWIGESKIFVGKAKVRYISISDKKKQTKKTPQNKQKNPKPRQKKTKPHHISNM